MDTVGFVLEVPGEICPREVIPLVGVGGIRAAEGDVLLHAYHRRVVLDRGIENTVLARRTCNLGPSGSVVRLLHPQVGGWQEGSKGRIKCDIDVSRNLDTRRDLRAG